MILKGARDVAVAVLSALEDDDAFLQPVLASFTHKANLDNRDRRLALQLVQGVMRGRNRLDYALDRFLHDGIERTHPQLLLILRVAAFQMLELDRIPTFAAVNAAVEQARLVRGEGGARLVNGVLRSMDRQGAPTPPLGADAHSISVRLSQPIWLIERWLKRDAAMTERWAEANNQPAPLTIRLDGDAPDRGSLGARLTLEGAEVQFTPHAPDGLIIKYHPDPFNSDSFKAGWWRAQDEASQLVACLLDAQPEDQIWDACAAPGGKTRAIARHLKGGHILATDIHSRKASRMRRDVRGLPIEVRIHDATQPIDAQFDRVLLDAPCTGLGIIRRHPEIKWRRQPEDIPPRAELQAQLLNSVADAVRPGGILVYSVCSPTIEEGPEGIAHFLARRPDFTLAEPEGPIDWTPLMTDGAFQVDPARHNMDAFYAVRLRRKKD